MALTFQFGRSHFDDLFARAKNCVLTTTTLQGEPHARMVRIATCSNEHGSHLWFVIPRDSDLASDIAFDPQVTLSVMNARSLKLVHVPGCATLVGARHNPVYLHRSLVDASTLNVVRDELDFSLLRIDIDEHEQPVASRSELHHDRVMPPLLGSRDLLRVAQRM